MNIEIHIPPSLEPFTGGSRLIAVGGSTAGECLDDLLARYPGLRERLFDEKGALRKGLDVFVNGRSTRPQGLARPVRDGDKIQIAYLIAGG